jgi:Fibronectin type III domain
MTTVNFGGTAATGGFTDDFIYIDTINVAAGRTAANGQGPVLITSIGQYMAGNGGARTMYLSLGSITTGAISVPSAGSATVKYSGSCNGLVANGANLRYTVNASPNGSFFFARQTSGGTIIDSYGTWGSGIPGGSYNYNESPTAPQTPGVTGGVGEATITWTAPSSDGGSSITGYKVEYATNSGFTTGVGSVTVGNVLTTTVTGLTNGITYWFRIYAINAVTSAASTTSVASSSVSSLISIWTYSGVASFKFTITAAGTFPNSVTVDLTHDIDVSTLDANDIFSASIHMSYSPVAGSVSPGLKIVPKFEWLDSGSTVISTTTAATVNLLQGETSFSFPNMTKPSSAVTGKFRINFPQTNSSSAANFTTGDIVYADAALLVNGSIIPFFDGDSAGASWLGANDNSVSSQVNPVVDNIIFDAETYGNMVLSADTGETVRTNIQTGNFPTALSTPVHSDTLPIAGGEYYVSDSVGTAVPEASWALYGGAVSVAIGETLGAIIVTFTAPSADIPGYTGPFYLASGTSASRTGQLSIAGDGVVAEPNTLSLATGADPEKTTVETAVTVDSPFIDTLDDAYSAGVWAGVSAAGPVVTLNVDVPTHKLAGFGVTPGSLIRYDDSIYRIVECDPAGATTSLSARWFVTASDFDSLWSGYDVDDIDALWGNYEAGDIVVAPLRQ